MPTAVRIPKIAIGNGSQNGASDCVQANAAETANPTATNVSTM